MTKLWVVEMWWEDTMRTYKPGWEPTLAIGLDRDEAMDELNEMRTKNPDDRFRIRVYKPQKRRP